jgi:hypothetical protein
MTNRKMNILLSAVLIFNFTGAHSSFAEEDPFPGVSTGSEIPGTKIWSQPGVTQSQWESTDTYKAFSCPAGAGNGMGVDMNFTTSKSDDRWFAYCVKTWRSSVDVNAEANFHKMQLLLPQRQNHRPGTQLILENKNAFNGDQSFTPTVYQLQVVAYVQML